MGSEGDARGIGVAAKKRRGGTKTSHKGNLEKEIFLFLFAQSKYMKEAIS